MSKASRHEKTAAARAQIERADPLSFLIDVMRGMPIPIRDERGRVVEFQDPLDATQRVSVASTLLGKVLPNLQTQSIELSGGQNGVPLQVILAPGIAPPGSIDDRSKDITPLPQAIEHTPATAVDLGDAAVCTRRTRT